MLWSEFKHPFVVTNRAVGFIDSFVQPAHPTPPKKDEWWGRVDVPPYRLPSSALLRSQHLRRIYPLNRSKHKRPNELSDRLAGFLTNPSHRSGSTGRFGNGAPGTNDHTTTETDLGPIFNPVWGVNPENTYIPNTRVRGLTSAVLRPGGDQIFTGQGAVIALDGESVPDMLRAESVAFYTAMGESGSSRVHLQPASLRHHLR